MYVYTYVMDTTPGYDGLDCVISPRFQQASTGLTRVIECNDVMDDVEVDGRQREIQAQKMKLATKQ